MGKNLILVILGALLLGIPSCAPAPKKVQKTVVVPVETGQHYEISIVEGKTTKQQVFDALGLPDDLSGSIKYVYKKKDTCKLSLTQKDGTVLNVVLGKEPGCKYDTMYVTFNDNATVKSVSLY